MNETYTPTASATSGDTVKIYLNSESTGCTLSSGKVTFTDNGVCVIDFNDPGNGAFAAATEVKQSITIGTGNPKSQGAIAITSTSTVFGHPLVLTSTGGSGNGSGGLRRDLAGHGQVLDKRDHAHQHACGYLRG